MPKFSVEHVQGVTEIEADDWKVEWGWVIFLRRPTGTEQQSLEPLKVWAAKFEGVYRIVIKE